MHSKSFFVKPIKMVKHKTHEPRQIGERRGIKNYKNMSKKELLSPIDESKKKDLI